MNKKLIPILLALVWCMTLVLSACGGSTGPGAADVTQEAAVTSSPDHTQDASATGTDGEQQTEQESYCIDYKSVMFSNMTVPVFAETDSTYYRLKDNILYFTDKEYKDWMPLCSRPDCKHDNADCNACVNSECLVLYDRYLYYVEGSGQHLSDNYKVDLCRMKFDGSEHETVCDLREMLEPEHSYKVDSSSWTVNSTGKYLIIRIFLAEKRGSGTIISHKYSFSFDMETQQFVPLFSEYSDNAQYGGFTLLEGRGSQAYGKIGYNDETPSIIVETDLATGETRELYEINDKDKELCHWYRNVGMMDGKLYFTMLDLLPERTEENPDPMYTEAELFHLYELDLETCECELVVEEPAVYAKWMVLDVDAGYWYGTVYSGDEDKFGTYICDLDRNEIAFIPVSDYPEEAQGKMLIGQITEDHIFAKPRDEDGIYNDDLLPVWYLSKADIGTDNLMWRKWEP